MVLVPMAAVAEPMGARDSSKWGAGGWAFVSTVNQIQGVSGVFTLWQGQTPKGAQEGRF